MLNMSGKDDSKRVVTSAIPGMSVREVRKCLSIVRSQWSAAKTTPFYITTPLAPDLASIQDFSMLFVIGQHRKRHSKSMQKM